MIFFVNVDGKLGVNKFNVDEDSLYIIFKIDFDKQVLEVLIKVCLVGLYKKQDDGSVCFDYVGCLECGMCWIFGFDMVLEKWEYLCGMFGVEFCYG